MGDSADEVTGERIVTEEMRRRLLRRQLVAHLVRLCPERIRALQAAWQSASEELTMPDGPGIHVARQPGTHPMFWRFASFISLCKFTDDHPDDYPVTRAYVNAVCALARDLSLTWRGELTVWGVQYLHQQANPDALNADVGDPREEAGELTASLHIRLTPYGTEWQTTRAPASPAPVEILSRARLLALRERGRDNRVGDGQIRARESGRFDEWDRLKDDLHAATDALVDDLRRRLRTAHTVTRPSGDKTVALKCERLAYILTGKVQQQAQEHDRLYRFCRRIGLDTPSRK